MSSVTGKIRRIFKVLGPGLITGASDDDPSGIATYTQAGAKFGLNTLWTAPFAFPLMAAIQGMCARIGLVTGDGLTVTLKQHYPRWVLYMMLLLSIPAITLNIGADIQGMGAVAHMIVPAVPAPIFSVASTLILIFTIIKFPYQKIARVLKWLCVSLLLYIAVPFMVRQNWGEILHSTLVPHFALTPEFLAVLVGILGTTISPYLFFWQATMEAEDIKHSKVIVDKAVLGDMRMDVNIGMLLSILVMFFMMLTAGTVLHTSGVTQIDTVDQAAQALAPLAGKLTYLIFATGVLGTGLLAIPVLAGAQSYMLAETFGWEEGLDKTFSQARPFYITVALSMLVGMCLDFIGITPVQALLYTAILYGITAPPIIAIILHIANNKKIMGDNTNSALSNVLGVITLLLMTAAAAALLWSLF